MIPPTSGDLAAVAEWNLVAFCLSSEDSPLDGTWNPWDSEGRFNRVARKDAGQEYNFGSQNSIIHFAGEEKQTQDYWRVGFLKRTHKW